MLFCTRGGRHYPPRHNYKQNPKRWRGRKGTNGSVANFEKLILEPSQRDAYAFAGLPSDHRMEREDQDHYGAVILPPDPV